MSTNNHHSFYDKSFGNRHALIFGFVSVFLIAIGFSIVNPVVPFLVKPYVLDTKQQAFFVTLLTSVYAGCMFLSAPVLGAISDRYGRRPILLTSLLGSAIGLFIFGLGGKLWVLFLGRIIEGISGGSIGMIFAYFADITPSNQRTKYFGWASAIAGIGSVMGPTIGGILSSLFSNQVPFYFGAILTLVNVGYGAFFMPESLKEENRLLSLTLKKFNPFLQLAQVFSLKMVGRLLFSGLLLWIPNGAMQAILAQFIVDIFHSRALIIGFIFSIMGLQDIISQAFFMPQLLKKFHDRQIVYIGIFAEIVGYVCIGLSASFVSFPLFILGMFFFGFGDSVLSPAFNGLLSKSAQSNEQGSVQGGSQAVQSLARIIGPIAGGQAYLVVSQAAPAYFGVVFLLAAMFVLLKKK
ncbi:MFS transporter [Vagococcus entomophilus]|uniref:Tetracycline resistance MFS efflux pump n=1 Tax=Vagococcus entomophilus TaxID=1160095 RepID=A0A430AHY8_9ENTE|nr:MFS transporter [Vagococcus entomophilus]RSU07736.1 tetracycline resistance MFS efflux pump [Vagococcus entomophilus]